MSTPPPPYAPVILKLLQGVMYSDDTHWDRLQTYLIPVKEYFNKIGLEVRNFDIDGFAYLEQPDPDPEEKLEPLPRLVARYRLSYKVTVLCVLLRDRLRIHDSSDVISRLVLSMEDIRDLVQPYLQERNNEEKFRKEVSALVKQAMELGFLRQLAGDVENYEIRPIIKAKIDADLLATLVQKLETYAHLSPGEEDE
jgi:hypothetical protein